MDGCFNVKRRPKIEQFHDCFPGKINFSDIDGVVEINGRALWLEWKSKGTNIPGGQRIMFTRLTKDETLTVCCVNGDAETMVINSAAWFYRGKFIPWKPISMDNLKVRFRRWAMWAQREEKLKAQG